MPSLGAGISIREISDYQRSSGLELSFAELAERATECGEVALGLLISEEDTGYAVELCPPPAMVCGENACVVVLNSRFTAK
jgi:hypothetical protein